MELVLLAGRLLLAAVFVIAGLTKLADPIGSRQAMRSFGVPARLAAPVGVALPIAELVIAVALIPIGTAWWGAVGALGLLLLFVAGIGYQIAHGRAPDCHCFGQLHSAPAGRATLARNGVLAAVAALVVATGREDPGLSSVAWIGTLSAAERVGLTLTAVTCLVLAGLVWAVIHLLGQHGRMLLRLDALEVGRSAGNVGAEIQQPANGQASQRGLPVGMVAPSFTLQGLHGETMTLDALRAPGKPVLVLFSDPGCGPCNALLPDIASWQRDHSAALTLALVSTGSIEANLPKATEHGIVTVLLQPEREIAQAYQAHGTPTAVLVRPDGTIGSQVAGGADAIRALVDATVGVGSPSRPVVPMVRAGVNDAALPAPTPTRPSRIGTQAPEFRLPDLNGKTVRLRDFRGQPTLVLFWNPGCGFCQRMLDDLKTWDSTREDGAPKLLLVSTGSVATNTEMGLNSTVVLDEGFATGQTFGAGGTPSAVLVDAKGKIATEVAVGGPAVLALAGAGAEEQTATA